MQQGGETFALSGKLLTHWLSESGRHNIRLKWTCNELI